MPRENRLRATRKSLPEIWFVLVRLKLARWRLALHSRGRAGSWRVISGESQRILPLQHPTEARRADAWRLGDICGAEELRLHLAQPGRFERS
jgi:hypothetical protein